MAKGPTVDGDASFNYSDDREANNVQRPLLVSGDQRVYGESFG